MSNNIRKEILDHMPTLVQKHLLMNKFMDQLEGLNQTVHLINEVSDNKNIVINLLIEDKPQKQNLNAPENSKPE